MDKKQSLKTAAYEVFSKKGYKATGISEIARQAGVAVGSFYNYYESKEAIFLDIYIDESTPRCDAHVPSSLGRWSFD